MFRNAFHKERVPEFVPFVGTMNEEFVPIFEEERNLEFVPLFLIFAIVPRSFLFPNFFLFKSDEKWVSMMHKFEEISFSRPWYTWWNANMCVLLYSIIFKVLFMNYVVSNRFIMFYVLRYQRDRYRRNRYTELNYITRHHKNYKVPFFYPFRE